ncbi:MAG: hypothetical protein F6K37_37830 [Moorea sp. SIO4E2]|uniref:hypothetical protein n=1 Tax=Moorena sp. SIO4E2 TaxID=2607826 RepID=UPI0013B6DD7A|nr:hypothetical protein [Moorena sp. SIO4E2]NEQ11447.1 hypothetical protein [Moorena sp. SIO4E2]
MSSLPIPVAACKNKTLGLLGLFASFDERVFNPPQTPKAAKLFRLPLVSLWLGRVFKLAVF